MMLFTHNVRKIKKNATDKNAEINGKCEDF